MNYLGVGAGLRRQHFSDSTEIQHQIDWFELLSENFMNYGGIPRKTITTLLEQNKKLICHGVGLSLGSTDPFDPEYLKSLKELLDFVDAPWFSDHLSFCSEKKVHYHDLIPVLRTKESLDHIVDRIQYVQEYFKRPFAFENASYYVETEYNEFAESEFINEIIRRTHCHMLLDVNNVYVNSINHDFDAREYIKSLDLDSVIQIHLAGHFTREDGLIIDTHGDFVRDEVWELYKFTLEQLGRPVSTLIEWDNEIPNFKTLEGEVLRAKNIIKELGWT